MQKLLVIMGTLFLVGGGIWLLPKNKSISQPYKETGEEYINNEKVEEMVNQGIPVRCIFDGNKGEMYAKSGNLYTMTKISGKDAHLISKEGCIWMWGDAYGQTGKGIKFCRQKMDLPNDSSAGNSEAGVSEYISGSKCRVVIYADDKFIPPAKIVFNEVSEDISKMLKQGGEDR